MAQMKGELSMEEQVLALAKGVAQEAEVFSIASRETPVSFEANRLKELQTKEVRGVALRVVANGRVGLASSTRWGNPVDLVASAMNMAQYGAEARFELPGHHQLPTVRVYDSAIEGLSVEQLVAMGQRMIDQVRSSDAAMLCDAGVRATVSTVRILNSRGADQTIQKSVLSGSLHGNLVRGTDMLDVYEEASSCQAGLDLDALATSVIRKTEYARQLAAITTGPMPVIFTPKGVAMTLIAPLSMALSGKMVFQGASPLGDKLGQVVADSGFSLHDDGMLDWASSSGSCDHEGVPCRRTALIEHGRVMHFYYDLQTAGLAGAMSTGNGFRSLDSLPGPGTTSLVVAPGNASLEEMLADVSEGLLVDQTMGAWSGNLISGEFSANVHLGYRISQGRIVGRVKDTMVAGNIFQALGGLAAVGARPEWAGDVFTPPLYFKSMGVASK
ncbi:MAG: metallopeptidase TldD-related protein [Chloroflexota bacterium]|nr:metallopeptidase TldD-related protein [Chloroflexota bacterium]